MSVNRLTLDKTELLWVRTRHSLYSTCAFSGAATRSWLTASDHVRLLGATILSDLNLDLCRQRILLLLANTTGVIGVHWTRSQQRHLYTRLLCPAPIGCDIMQWWPLSVCPCLLLSREWNGVASWKLAGRKPWVTDPVPIERWKVKVTRQINAVTENQPYLRNGKAYELQTWYTDANMTDNIGRDKNISYGWSASWTCAMTSKLKALGRCSSHHSQGRGILWRPHYRPHRLLYRVSTTVTAYWQVHQRSRLTRMNTFNDTARVLISTHKFDRGLLRLLHTQLHWFDLSEWHISSWVIVFSFQHSPAPQYLMYGILS